MAPESEEEEEEEEEEYRFCYVHTRFVPQSSSCYPMNVCEPGRMCEKNSARVRGSFWNAPSTELVTVDDPVFCTPRITMHMCDDSITTATP